SFTVTNEGGDAARETDITIVALNQGEQGSQVILSETQEILENGQQTEHTFTFNTADYPANSRQPFIIEVGIENEILDLNAASDNRGEIIVPIPLNEPASDADDTITTDVSENITTPFFKINPDGSVSIADRTFDRDQILTAVIGLVGAVVLLWLLSIVLRLIFRRSPSLGNWQPPYSVIPTLDPNSTEGRRQAWQQHAVNGSILAMNAPGNVHPVKLLMSSDGQYMKNWRVTALRLSQYDQYGRVSRSETIAPKKLVNRLNKVLKRNEKLSAEQMNKRLRPIAKSFVKQLRKNVKKRNTYLALALDIRFEGKQDEVRILFELYQADGKTWHRIDQWEPMMAVMGSRLPENYTGTIHGMGGGETVREFYKRLVDDVTWLLRESLRHRPQQPESQPAVPQPFNVPDTLSGMESINESEMIRM
ncbi:MAG: hypothetical protein ACPG7F_19180, partial [Aggregatilineales bacterium]